MLHDKLCVHYREPFDPECFVKGEEPCFIERQEGCNEDGVTIAAGIARWRDENEKLYEIPVANLMGVYPL